MWANAVVTTSTKCARLNDPLSPILKYHEEECRKGLHLWNVRSLHNLVLLTFCSGKRKTLIILMFCALLPFLWPNADGTTGKLTLGLRVRVPSALTGAVAQWVEQRRLINTCRPSFVNEGVVGKRYGR